MKYLLSFIILFGTPTSVQASDENGEIFCLAKNMYFEAGNQPIAGKIAVGHVVMNRVYSMSYPDTVSGTITGKEQLFRLEICVSFLGSVMVNLIYQKIVIHGCIH
jgi:hypothetical protein